MKVHCCLPPKGCGILEPINPGEILREDFIEPLDISINQLSRDLAVPPTG